MILNEKYTLSNGNEIPKLGLGTWFINDADAAQAVKDAIQLGCRHIDTAQAYQNERGVGEGVRTCGVQREDVFVTTKLAAEIKSYKEAVVSIDNSLKTLGLDYIDLMIIHSPKPWMEFHESEPFFAGNREAWRALEEAYAAGKLRAIGLSNFEIADLNNILESCSVRPMVNKVLVHITNTPDQLIQYSKDNGMLVEAYSPVAHGELLKNKTIVEIAEKYGVSVPQLSIRYSLELGLLPLPKTANPAHMKNNADVDFQISKEDLDVMKNMEKMKDYGEASVFPVYGGKLKCGESNDISVLSVVVAGLMCFTLTVINSKASAVEPYGLAMSDTAVIEKDEPFTTENTKTMFIQVQANGKMTVFRFNDSSAAKALYDQLPFFIVFVSR